MQGDRGKQRLYLYLPAELVAEIDETARRLDRSRSWVLQRAWRMARGALDELPSVPPARPRR